MKQGWQIKKLGSLCSFERGLTYSKGDETAFSNKGVLRSNNVDLASNTLNFDEIKYLKEEIEIPVSKKVKRNGLLMCMSNGSKAHLGKVAIIEDDLDFAFGGFMGLLVPDEAIVFPRYFYYALITPIYKSFIKGLSDGANINNLKFADLKEFEILLPSISEQQRIVYLLDAEFAKIDTLKANAERNLQNAKDLFQAALKKELEPKEGWRQYKLGDICTITSSKRIYKNEYVSEGIPFYRTKEVKEISNGRPITIELYISKERYTEIKEKFGVPQINDMLVSAVGTIGEIMIVKDEKPFYFKDGNLVWLKSITKTTPEYLRYYLLSEINRIKGMTYGAAYNALTIERFQEMEIGLASSEQVQNTIVARLDALSEKSKTLQENYEKTIALCDDLKQALLRKAFNGEI